MRFAILADIHGNLPAFEAALCPYAQWRQETSIALSQAVDRFLTARESGIIQ